MGIKIEDIIERYGKDTADDIIEFIKSRQKTPADEIKEMFKARRDFLDIAEEVGVDIMPFLTGMYVQETHFVIELLQNAEDVGATKAVFIFKDDCLIFRHNSERLFSREDIIAIMGIGKSTKKDAVNKIGRFGVGIKAIFGMAEAYEIHSGGYDVLIKELILPVPIDGAGNTDTMFKIMFKDKDAIPKILDYMKKLPPYLNLFLNSIDIIECYDDEALACYWYKTLIKKDAPGDLTQIQTEKGETHWLKFAEKSDRFPACIAYRTDGADDYKLLPADDTRICVFFETDQLSGLRFLAHAPFRTTPSRENIPMDLDDNKAILDRLCNTFKESVIALSPRFSISDLEIMPINPDNTDKVYAPLYQTLCGLLKEQAIIPVKGGERARFADAVTADCAELYNIADAGDLSGGIIEFTDNEAISRFFEENEVPTIELDTYLHDLDDAFLSEKPVDWLINLYKHIPERQNINDCVIIRTKSGAHITPAEAYLPSADFEYPEHQAADIFIDYVKDWVRPALPLERFISDIVLPKYTNDKPPEDYDYHLELLLKLKKSGVSLEQYFKDYKLFLCEDGIMRGADDVVIKDERHSALPFLDWKYVRSDYAARAAEILADADRELHMKLNYSWNWTYNGTSPFTKNYFNGGICGTEIEGLEDQLANITVESSAALVSLLSEIDKKYFYGTSRRGIDIDWSRMAQYLRKYKWLKTSNGDFAGPREISIWELSDDYDKTKLLNRAHEIGFMSETSVTDDLLDINNQTADELLKGLSFEQKGKLRALLKQGMDLLAALQKIMPQEPQIPDITMFEAYGDDCFYSDETSEAGLRYEQAAFDYLKEGFRDKGFDVTVTDSGFEAVSGEDTYTLHKMDTALYKQQGYDFLLEKNGEPIQYIEVKGSKQNDYHLSRSQFHLALKFYYEGEEEKYRLLLLNGSGDIKDVNKVLTALAEGTLELYPAGIKVCA